ncbi:hypothetical protein PM082_020205 [Marasmius tenuissimus]|nr:hypothetical protein PM082_020205 [Marasmius tenuissimus]
MVSLSATVSAPGPRKTRKWKNRFSALVQPTKKLLKRASVPPKASTRQVTVKRYSTVGVQAGCSTIIERRPIRPISVECHAPTRRRVSGDSRFREEIHEGEDYEDEAFQHAMDALPPLRHRFI